ncbi:MAG: phosphoribosylglycinamide formyltransferase [Candidatus Hydrothermales bacterium]
MKILKIGALASGRGSNVEAILKNIKEGLLPCEMRIVISDNPNAPVLKIAEKYGVKALYIDPGKRKHTLEPEREEEYAKVLKQEGVELVVLAGFMRILKGALLREFKNRIMNIHPSLLPSFKGLEAQRQAIEYGVKVSGCTVHFVDETVDGGPIILQRCVPVYDDDTPETLAERILKEEHKIYSEAIKLYAEGRLKIEGRRVIIIKKD